SQSSFHSHNAGGFSNAHVQMPDDDLTTRPASHLSQAATFVPVNATNPGQNIRQSTPQQQSVPFQNFEERQKGGTGEILPTQHVPPPVESVGNEVGAYQPYPSQQRASGRRRIILAIACALLAMAMIAPLLFVGLPNLLQARSSTKIVYVPVTATSARSTSTVGAHGKALSGQPTHPTERPTRPIISSGSTPLPISTPTTVPPTISPTQAPPTPTATQKPITAETFRVYFDSANVNGLGISTQHTYSGTVSILVSGYGQASSTEYSDAFYIYTDPAGTPTTPHTATCWILYINGNTADASVGLPSYNSSHIYSVSMNLSQPGTINFGICDGQPADNTGYLTITVQQQ
ncbi:MAG TPA: hypothetical protein VJ761_04785, partial [Ktedonobacteraceae bacterium]|nr:hypothetical protein [Ktedonobacteraceae bacterium]